MKRYNGPLMKLISGFDIKDPWPEEVYDELNGPDAVELCIDCLEPQKKGNWLCHNCGWPTGTYNNVMDYMYIFSIGALLRSGVDGSVKLTKLRIFGLALFSLLEYTVFAPFYWYRLYNATKGRFLPRRQHRIARERKSEQDDGINSVTSLRDSTS